MPTYLNYLYSFMSQSAVSRITGIPRATLYDYTKGFYKPSLPRLKILKSTYGKAVYGALRGSGASTVIASRYRLASPETVDDLMIRLNMLAYEIAQNRDVELEVILENMAQSEKELEDMEEVSP